MKTPVMLVLACSCLMAACNNDKDKHRNNDGSMSGGSMSSSSDAAWMREAAMGGMAEAQMGQLAAQRAQNADVRRFGQRMADDHSRANTDLKSVARGENVDLPTRLDSQHQQMADMLMRKSGSDFDREYMRMMLEDHDKDVDSYDRASRSASDADVRSFAQRTLPTLREHQQMARDISGRMGTR